ncbi:uncharacterized protein A1O5_06337 [Cladophialophora psammophila CBS 110553]|uniref:Major facilitator superfamily (MFS) profile domain-containing protein n=1 Tax=Cladophialophora psammophila CBS 110553 TaxID=1182543 RepID=W9XIS2_9EURO|nr:uncharacterized protein A1O5_06337 [Cladophialophora psammophila CBS 110553]EXJ70269.1 hypothetical protein A1O5_06337 [Cladophialophora psammophila CBS 110553]
MDSTSPITTLRKLEIEHADAGVLQDIEISKALTTDQSTLAEKGYFFHAQLVGSIASISCAVLASYWGFAPAAAILTEINADIGPSENASLFSIIWTLCVGLAAILFGRTSDKFGRRWFVIGASTMSFIGGIIACTAKNMDILIGANVLLGLGAGVHTCYALIVGEICPNKYKFVGIVFCVIPNVVPTGFGAYLALMLVHNADWRRWVYYIQLMMMFPAIILQLVYYRPPGFKRLHGNTRTWSEEIKRVDIVGAILLSAGLCLFILGISWGGQPLPWTSSRILGLTISGGITCVIFTLWEIYSKVPNPLVPMYVFRDLRGYVCLTVIISVSGVIYIALSIIWPSQVARIYGAGATSWQGNAWLSTTVAFGIWGGIVGFGSIFHIVKHIRYQLIVYMSVTVVFCGALSTCNTQNKGQSAAFSFLATLCAGMLEVTPGVLVQLDADDANLGTVTTVLGLIRTATGSIMTAVFLAILSSKVPKEILRNVPPAAVDAGLPKSSLPALLAAITTGTSEAYAKVPGLTAKIEAVVSEALAQSYAAAYAYVYYAAVAVGIVGMVAVIAIKDYDSMLTGHVPRQIYKRGEEDEKVREEVENKLEPTKLRVEHKGQDA